jgi:hypothetical protein
VSVRAPLHPPAPRGYPISILKQTATFEPQQTEHSTHHSQAAVNLTPPARRKSTMLPSKALYQNQSRPSYPTGCSPRASSEVTVTASHHLLEKEDHAQSLDELPPQSLWRRRRRLVEYATYSLSSCLLLAVIVFLSGRNQRLQAQMRTSMLVCEWKEIIFPPPPPFFSFFSSLNFPRLGAAMSFTDVSSIENSSCERSGGMAGTRMEFWRRRA